MQKFLSRKLIVTLITDALTLYMAFGGHLDSNQAMAIIACVNSMYLAMNAVSKVVDVRTTAL